MKQKEILAGRWQIDVRVFVEYTRGRGISIDVGPYPGDPDDSEITIAIEYLESLKMDFLNLEGPDWTLNLDALVGTFPELNGEALTGTLVHPPAFLVSRVFDPVQIIGRNHAEYLNEQRYLRIDFEFTPSEVLPEYVSDEFSDELAPNAASPASGWKPPNIISD